MEENATSFSFQAWSKANNELQELIDEGERYWKQRSREDWLKLRHRNSKWFHHKASFRRCSNGILRLEDKSDNWITSQAKVGILAIKYFSFVYNSSDPSV